ncbi:MAG: magnesium transporter [Candidatus Omnitrophica bacterium]|nr:magnesium transporter [Candidatus Omnitrophota bacterium]
MDEQIIKKAEELIAQRKLSELKEIIPQRPEDIAHFISHLFSSSWKMIVFRMIPQETAVEVFMNFASEEQEKILENLTSVEIRRILNEMSVDDRTGLFEEMPAELVKKFMTYLYYEEREITRQILNYPEKSVGRLMTPDFVQLYEDMTVEAALEHVKQIGLKKETVYHSYVLNSERKLIGVVSLKKMVLSNAGTLIKDIMYKDVSKINAYCDQEDALAIFKKYDLLALPVTDNNEKLLGIITFDDLVDIVDEEATEDFQKIAAVVPMQEPYLEANILNILWKRSFWLILLVILGSVSGFILQTFQLTMQKWIALSFFLPMLINTAGNAGTQSATIVIRSLTVGEIKINDFLKLILRESMLGALLGVILALACVLRVFFQEYNWHLSLSVGLSMGLTVVISSVIGAGLPIVLKKIRLDPALMSGPLLTTIIDIVGIIIYFGTANLLLGTFFKTI